MTGVSEFTLRGWETRYKAFNPHRTKSGRRRYCEDDLLRSRALLSLTNQGHRIGAIAKLSLKDLQNLMDKTPPDSEVHNSKDHQIASIKQLISAAHNFNWKKAQDLIKKNTNQRSASHFIFEFLIPLLHAIGHEVAEGRLSIAQEHILSSFLKEHLYFLKTKEHKKKSNKIRIVLAAPEGDFHDIGLLIASVIAQKSGANLLYLGPHMPKADLCETSLRFGATHLLLSMTISKTEGAQDDIYQYIHFLDRNLDPKIHLWLAGRKTKNISLQLKRPFQIFNNFHDFEKELKKSNRN